MGVVVGELKLATLFTRTVKSSPLSSSLIFFFIVRYTGRHVLTIHFDEV